MATRSFHDIDVDGEPVTLRVFTPAKEHGTGVKPAVVMVCGLLWFGNGFLGRIGLGFNDKFGYEFARSGVPCVQVHTPSRHLAHTRLMDIAAALLWPLSWHPLLSLPILIFDVLMLGITPIDFCLLLALPFLRLLGPLALPVVHLGLRSLQYAQGTIAAPYRSHQRDIAAAVAWAEKNKETLGSNGRLCLCGYSSGGHCASLYALSASAPRFESVVLISGLYNLRTHAWTGFRRFLAPIFNFVYSEILGLATAKDRDRESPEFLAPTSKANLDGQKWFVLSAKMELMGLEPFQDIFFQAEPLCTALRMRGAKVDRVTCGLNHWLLVINIADFLKPYCQGL